MSRDAGFSRADVDTGILADVKFRALWRRVDDDARMARAFTLYMAILTESWGAGCRLSAAEAAPLWLNGVAELEADLAAVELLDTEGRIPTRAWSSWFEPASARRQATLDRWQKANEKRADERRRSRDDEPRGNSEDTASEPRGYTRSDRSIRSVHQTGPSGPSQQRAHEPRARRGVVIDSDGRRFTPSRQGPPLPAGTFREAMTRAAPPGSFVATHVPQRVGDIAESVLSDLLDQTDEGPGDDDA